MSRAWNFPDISWNFDASFHPDDNGHSDYYLEVDKVLGKGGFGVVLKVRLNGKVCALKISKNPEEIGNTDQSDGTSKRNANDLGIKLCF